MVITLSNGKKSLEEYLASEYPSHWCKPMGISFIVEWGNGCITVFVVAKGVDSGGRKDEYFKGSVLYVLQDEYSSRSVFEVYTSFSEAIHVEPTHMGAVAYIVSILEKLSRVSMVHRLTRNCVEE